MKVRAKKNLAVSRRVPKQIIALFTLSVLGMPTTVYADVAPGPVEFSMFAFVWGMTTLVLGAAIYFIATRIRGRSPTPTNSAETPAPSVWKRPVFRRSLAVAAVVAFIGWFAFSSWMLQENRRQRDNLRLRHYMEEQERKAHSTSGSENKK